MDPITAFLVNLAIGAALSLLGQLLKPKPAKAKPTGIRGTETTGGDSPLSFIMGRFGTAGHREYSGTWGNEGETPNAYYTLIRSVSDLPVRGMAGLFFEGARVTIGDVHHANGYPILEKRVGGIDHLWIEFFDGTQTTADSFMLDKFGSDPDRPWLSDMIGRGIAYGRLTARYNREIFNDLPDPFFEIDGIDATDPRGDDAQDNPMVHIHQVLSGISYDGEWVWGLQDLPATRLPSGNWEAQMDKCDVDIDLAGGGTEPRFRSGCEISVDQQPIDVIAEMLESCNGRIAEIGGIYKVLVAEPDEPVASFTDEDIVITQGQSYEPFPGLETTYNGITATYLEPDEKWTVKQAPALRDTDLENDDDGRKLPADVAFSMVYSGTQTQRLMSALLLEDRRFRTHAQTMPPEWWEYEVLDTVEWTSVRNGYAGKSFLLTTMDDLPNGNQFIGLKEQDPADYVPPQEYAPSEVVPIVVSRPAAQPMSGWSVAPYIYVDNAGGARRPGIEVGFAAGLVDVRAVRVQVRLDGEELPVFDGEVPYDSTEVDPRRAVYGNFILSDTDYEVRGRLLPFSGRETEWSDWLSVTTPEVGIAPGDLGETLSNMLDFFGLSVRDLNEQMQLATSLGADQDAGNYQDRLYLLNRVSIGDGATYAASTEALLLALGVDGSSLADAVTAIDAAAGDVTAGFLSRITASASPGGAWVRYGQQIRAGFGDDLVTVSDFWEVNSISGLSRRVTKATEHYIVDDSNNVLALFAAGGASFENARIVNLDADNISVKSLDADEVLVDGTLVTDLIAAQAVTAFAITTPSGSAMFTTGEVTRQTLAFQTDDGSVLIDVDFNVDFNSANSSAFGDVRYRLRKNGSTILAERIGNVDDSWTALQHFMTVDDTPGIGMNTYTFTVQSISGSGPTLEHFTDQCVIRCMAGKR